MDMFFKAFQKEKSQLKCKSYLPLIPKQESLLKTLFSDIHLGRKLLHLYQWVILDLFTNNKFEYEKIFFRLLSFPMWIRDRHFFSPVATAPDSLPRICFGVKCGTSYALKKTDQHAKKSNSHILKSYLWTSLLLLRNGNYLASYYFSWG